MELVTLGRNIYPGCTVALWHNDAEVFQPIRERNRFRVVLVQKGTGIYRLGVRRGTFIAPALFCLNETEEPELEKSVDLQARAYYFHPNVINSKFDFENIRQDEVELTLTERHDRSLLRLFVERNQDYFGQLNIGPASARRILTMFDLINKELEQQPDYYWPCRSRSYFLELMFFMERIYSAPGSSDQIMLPEKPGQMDPVIFYLHTHYQTKITIAELTKVFHQNRTTLTQCFLEETGVSIMSYLINLRLRLASLMLRDTTIPISEVMQRVGFNDMTHFGRMFRRSTGMSPSQYRQQYCWVQ
jgi:AraC-like DNA-binding protein